MAARLNVTEAERLCYSRRKLQALSALRNAGLDAGGVIREKAPLPDRSGCFYRLMDPEGKAIYFSTLRQIVAYADDYRTYMATMALLEADEWISWQQWRRDGTAYALALLVPQLRAISRQSASKNRQPAAANTSIQGVCSDAQCSYPATDLLDGKPYCAGHSMVYSTLAAIQEARGGAALSATRYPTAGEIQMRTWP